MSTPIISLVIVIKGPVARAGSILSFSRVRGTIVPNIEANNTTASSDNDTAAVMALLSKKNRLYTNTSMEIIVALIVATPLSLNT